MLCACRRRRFVFAVGSSKLTARRKAASMRPLLLQDPITRGLVTTFAITMRLHRILNDLHARAT